MTLPNPLYAFVLEDGIKETSSKGRYYQHCLFKTNYGQLKTRIWNASPEKDNIYPHKGDILEVTDFLDQLDTHGSIVLHSYKKIIKEQLPDNEKSICEFPKVPREKIIEALQYIGNINLYKDPKNRDLVSRCFSIVDKEALFSCPAAEKMHHALGGGLVIHTAQVVKIAKAIYDAIDCSFVSNDVVVVSAALHDIGKVKTYAIDEVGIPSRLVAEKIIGHMYFGIELVRSAGLDVLADQEFIDEVCHCIASHHGKAEYGSMKSIQSQEALIVHLADLISSRNDMLGNKLESDFKEGLPDTFNILSDQYFATIGMKACLKK
jgi:3'-5' exoribonuclease